MLARILQPDRKYLYFSHLYSEATFHHDDVR